MASLRDVTVNYFIKQEPSPTNCLLNSAQETWNSNNLFIARGPSLPTLKRKKSIRGSMTLEAAIVLPIFLFFLLSLGSAIEMMRLHNLLQVALFDTGNRVSLYACEHGGETVASLLTAFYVRNRIEGFVGEDYLEESPLVGGGGGIRLWEGEMLSEEDELEIVLTYKARPTSFLNVREIRMTNRYVAHLWNGYEIPKNPSERGLVYVTVEGEAYHRKRSCTYLVLTVYNIRSEALAYERNQKGKKYRACELCAHGELPDLVYVTGEGECFHMERQCSGLKRTVIAIPEEEKGGYRPCSRCSRE